MLSREERIENYYDNCSIQELAEWMVDLEDDHRVLQFAIDRLEKRSERLAALEAAGVDNWEGYSDALQDEDE